ncbi:MAG: hypothetical protein LUG16_08760 [Candidatus Gastranaerophilales bacterium]|nr:hypothetical protein [Candidatus Gastranaerophilales bacterium]
MNKFYLIILIAALIAIGYGIYNKLSHLSIIVNFKDMEPFEKNLSVYYKGFKVGKTTKIYPDKHYKNTFVKLNLHPADVELPDNIRARVQKSNRTDYINLVAPDEASVVMLKNGDIIQGELSKDINKLLSDKLNNGGLDTIFNDADSLMQSANKTVQSLGNLFDNINEILSDVKGDIKTASSNLAKATSNLENLSSNLDSALDGKTMKDSAQNIKDTTENIKNITTDLNNITTQVDRATMPILNSALCHVNGTAKNADEISLGIKHTLSKKMGLSRLLFGKPVSNICD